MAKDKPVEEELKKDRTLKTCPSCHATRFQGPFQRGEIINGNFVVIEVLYQCVNCNRVVPVEQMEEFTVPVM